MLARMAAPVRIAPAVRVPEAAPVPARIADAHHHLWDLSTGRYPWLQGPREDPEDPTGLGSLQKDYLVRDFLGDVGGTPVAASVHVEAARLSSEAVAETRWVQGCADRGPFPHALVVAARLQLPDIKEQLSAHTESAAVRGVRQMLNWAPDQQVAERPDLMADPAWRRGLACLADFGLSFDLQVFPHQLQEAAEIVAQNPETTFILNHGGYLRPDEPDLRTIWRRGLALLATHDNVVVKISSYASVDPAMRISGLRSFVDDILFAFGPGRAMFASNFPVDGRFISYPDLIAAYAQVTEDLWDAERDAFFYTNAVRYYRLFEDDESTLGVNREAKFTE
jgi:predicted TIM-barrel fold metal-dependent hydrolase